MKRSAVILLSVVAVITVTAIFLLQPTKSQEPSNAEQEIRATEALKLQYPLEPARWSGSVDDNAVFTQGGGKVVTKAQLLNTYRQQGDALKNSTEMMDPQFQRFGDVAVLTYIYTRTEKDRSYILHKHVRRTAVYQLVQSHWRLIASTAVGLPNADRKQKPVDAKILDTYTGLYETNLRITRDGTRIMAQDPNDKEKVELLAISNDAFAIEGESNSILFVFEKGEDGRSQIRVHDIGGSESVMKRMD